MTIYQALQIHRQGASIYFTNLKIDGRFDNERAMASDRSSLVFNYDPLTSDDGFIFNVGLGYRSIVICDEENGNVIVNEEFTHTTGARRMYQIPYV